MAHEILNPQSVEEIVKIVRSKRSLIPRGGGTKPALWSVEDSASIIDIGKLAGIEEYQPSEYTITVKSGTKLSEVISVLKENKQYLPFDPPFASEGSTIGGAVASGLSGPGAYRFGPLKDFIIGVRFIDGLGNNIRGGGKVVKNAAGFDFPKLFNGSIGRLGILTEVSFKVFPEPQEYVTLRAQFSSPEEALAVMPGLKGFDLEGVELNSDSHLALRLAYQEPTMEARKAALEKQVGKPLEMSLGDEEPDLWNSIKAFSWAQTDGYLFKIATHPVSATGIAQALNKETWKIHFTNGAKTIYLSSDDPSGVESINRLLVEHNMAGLLLRGPATADPLIGAYSGLSFVTRVQTALDPQGVFQKFSSTTFAAN